MLVSRMLENNLFYFLSEYAFSSIADKDYDYEIKVIDKEIYLTESLDENYTLANHRLYMFRHAPLIYKQEAQYEIKIKKNGFDIDPANYIIDYFRGRCIFTVAYADTIQKVDIISVDFTYVFVYITLDDLDTIYQDIELYPLPLIVLEGMPFRDIPFELGNSKGKFQRRYLIHVFGKNGGQRDDLLQIILEHFRTVLPLKDYSNGFPLLEDGTVNLGFSTSVIGSIIPTDTVADIQKMDKPNQVNKHWGYLNTLIEVVHNL